jgi:phosphoglucomutase
MTLLDALNELYKKYGYYKEAVVSITLAGVEGINDMKRVMASMRQNPPKELAGREVLIVADYLNKTVVYTNENRTEATVLPVSDVLHYSLEGSSWVCVRPSGTEPKIKLYCGVCAKNAGLEEAKKEAAENFDALAAELKGIVNGALGK